MFSYKYPITLCLVVLIAAFSCTKDDGDDGDSPQDFDRATLLSDVSELIERSYADYITTLSQLESDVSEFSSSPNASTLETTRNSWRASLLQWQHVAPFDFGKATDLGLNTSNKFPVSTGQIESNISTGTYNLDAALNVAAGGLQALDYLLFGIGDTDENILAMYTDDTSAEARKQYLVDVVANMKTKAEMVAETWEPGASERADFIANDGTDDASSMHDFLNAFNRTYEKSTRTKKLGTPVGALTFSGAPNPTTVEAYYENNNSIAYLRESIAVFEEIYLGTDDDDLSLEEHLIQYDARHGEELLDEVIKQQLVMVGEAIDNLQDPLSDFVANDQQTALDTYAELQAMVTLWKIDMMSSVGVEITYQDTDGD